jgi:hypothetical protein
MTIPSSPKTTEDRLARLKAILQENLTSGAFEKLTAALLSDLLGVAIAIARSGFQHGGDAGPAGRQGRRFRIETKRYADTTSLSDRELLGEVDHAVNGDPAIEAWFLTATRAAPEQLEQDLQRKSDALGLPIAVIDWKSDAFPALAALCTSAPKVLEAMVSKEAGDIAQALVPEGKVALASLMRDLESWNLGFERLRTLSLDRLTTIWTKPRTSMAALGQDAAGGHHLGTIRRQRSFAAMSAWWVGRATADAPAAMIGWEGVGKTWAALDWLTDRQAELPIILVVPSSALAGIASVTPAAVKQFVGERLYDLTEARDPKHWQMRFDRLLRRPFEEGPVLTLLFDGLNQEPSAPWLEIMRTFQDSAFAGRVRLILTTRNLHFTDRLSSLRGLIEAPEVIIVDTYDDAPGGELDQRLKAEGLSRNDLHNELIPLARTPRLFNLVVRFRDRLVHAGQVTVHRLLWEYGRDTLGTRAGRSFSEEEWRSWLQEVARRHLAGTRDYNLRELGDTAHRSDLTPTEVFRRLSDIVDAQFATRNPAGRLRLTPTLVAHALSAALLADIDELGAMHRDAVERRLAEWFDPIDGLDEKAEILRAAVSIRLERDAGKPSVVISSLVSEWLRSQNIPDEHRSELARIAAPLCNALLDAIEQNNDGAQKSARLWAVNALRAVPRADTATLTKIVERATYWLRVVSRDVDLPNRRHSDSEKARAARLLRRVGFDANGQVTVLGQPLVFVERHDNTAALTIPSVLEGFPLAMALPVFEAAALAMAIRGREECWDGLKWLCLLNDADFDTTAAALRTKSAEIASLPPEAGVHPELPLRVAALLLWLSGNEDDEAAAAQLNPPLDQNFSYARDYAAHPSTSWFMLERRHAEQILNDKSIALHRRIDRTRRFFSDPHFIPPSDFCTDLREQAAAFDVSALDTNLSLTGENHAFEALAPVLARCAPGVLADLMRKKLTGFATRPAEQRYASAVHATEQLLLANNECAAAARALRLNHQDPDENNETFVATHLLMLEIQDLAASDQVITIIDADLKDIFLDVTSVLKPLSGKETDALVQLYAASTNKKISDLVLLLSQSATDFNEGAWQWLASLAQDEAFHHRGIAFKMLNAADQQRFGRMLAGVGWSWHPDGNLWCNHFGSLALIAGTSGLPFEQSISSIAPWLLLQAVALRGGSAADAQLAAEVFGSILRIPGTDVPDLGSDISVDNERRKIDPFTLSITIRPEGDDDAFAALRASMDTEKRIEARQRAIDTAVNRINTARLSGASLYLHNVDASDFAPIIEHASAAIAKWLEGADAVTSDFKRRVRLAEGVHLALCESLLSLSPHQGATLWRGLRKTLRTRYLGRGQVEEMIHMLFRSVNASDALREEQLSLMQTNTDQALFELAVGASMNGARAWLDRAIAADLASGVVWREQRARILVGFTTGNALPVSGAWPEGPAEDLRTSRQRETAHWQHKEACARHWWNAYWRATAEEEAYAAWVLFLETADRRAYEWMNFEQEALDRQNPATQRRLAHFYSNESMLKSAMSKQEKKLEGHFLRRKIGEGIGPWGKVRS